MDGDRAVLPAPDVDADTHRVRRLLRELPAERRSDLDERELERLQLVRPDGLADQLRVRQKRARHRPRVRERQAALNALPDVILRPGGPRGKIQNSALMRTEDCRTAELRAEHLQRRADRLLVVRRGGNARQNVRHERNLCRPVAVNALHHVGDEVAIAQMTLPLRHTDEHKIVLIRNVDEPPVHARQIHAYIVQDKPDLPAVNEPQKVGALQIHILHAVEKAGDDDLAAGILVVLEHLVHQHARVGRFQHRDGRHRSGKSPFAAQNPRLPQRRQFQKLRHRHAHAITLFL